MFKKIIPFCHADSQIFFQYDKVFSFLYHSSLLKRIKFRQIFCLSNNKNMKQISQDTYELHADCAFYMLFEVLEYLPVGTVVGEGQQIACCGTECQLISVYVDFCCKVVEVNHPFIDYLKFKNGRDFEDKFPQNTWICRVQKASSHENSNPDFHKGYKMYGASKWVYTEYPWYRQINAYTIQMGYFDDSLPLEYDMRNFQLLGEKFKTGEKVCSFEYYSKFSLKDATEKWQLAEKFKKTGYLYAPFDIENICFNEKLLLQAQYNPQPNGWIAVHIKEDFILQATKTVNYYTNYTYWYKTEGDLIRIGLDINANEYVYVHLPAYPMEHVPIGRVFIANGVWEQSQEMCWIDVSGPIGVWIYPEFDMEIVEINPKVWDKLGEPCEVLARDICYNEGWLFVVKPLNPEKTAKMFAEWREKGKFK